MRLDFEDLLAGTIGGITTTTLFFATAVWVGSWIGGLALMIGEVTFLDFPLAPGLEVLIYAPVLLLNLWLIPNVAFLAIMLIYVLFRDGAGHVAWGVTVGVESLFLMLGWCLRFHEPKELLIAWSCWLILLGMAEAGIWLHRQMRHNRWVRAMAELSAENAMLRAQRAAMAVEEPVKEPDLK